MIRNKILLISLICLLILFKSPLLFSANWEELSGHHFIIYYIGEENFAKDVLDKAEDHYKRIALELGYPRYSQFWLWDDRAKIYIYPDHKSYISATHQPKWSHGLADYNKKQL